MYSVLFWFLAVGGFVAQILCCVYGRNKLIRLLPMAVMLVVMVGTVALGVGIGGMAWFAAFALVWNELKVLAVLALAYGLCALVKFAKK